MSTSPLSLGCLRSAKALIVAGVDAKCAWRAIAVALVVVGAVISRVAHAQTLEQRLVLPIQPPPFAGRIGPDVESSIADWPTPVNAPKGAPNVLLVMTDDVGFGASSTFGGPIPTPTLDQLAKRGLRFNQFHTTGICSPSRAALLTGRNHHNVGAGHLVNLPGGFPGYTGIVPPSAATIAQILRLNGYNTAMFGKHHNTPAWANSAAGPFDTWPTGLGFEYFFGFLAEAQHFNTPLYRGVTRVEEDRSGRLLEERLTTDAIEWIHDQQATYANKPFFVYYAAPSMHAPHQAAPEWFGKFRNRFDMGWDRLREETYARQKVQGIIPSTAALSPRPHELPAWDGLTLSEKRYHARMMEVAAGMLAYQDNQFGRIIDELDRMGILDNTLVIFIEGDNGASGEGGPEGAINEYADMVNKIGEAATPTAADINIMGSSRTSENYSAAWAWAMNTPFQWLKQLPAYFGGTRNGLVISWPARIKADSKMRGGFSHVTDITPTILEAVGIPAPRSVFGIEQTPLDGKSLVGAFDSSKWLGHHLTQYFEIGGNFAIYHDGWMASSKPRRMPWVLEQKTALDQNAEWELYDIRNDFSQAHDIADKKPQILREMQALWEREALKNNVFPIDGRISLEKTQGNRAMFGPPRNVYDYWSAGTKVPATRAPNLAGQSFAISAEVDLAKDEASGAIVAYGSDLGGWSFYLDRGHPAVLQALSQKSSDHITVVSNEALASGPASIRFEFKSEGGIYAGGEIKIFANGRLMASGRMPKTIVRPGSALETLDIGQDTGGLVLPYAVEGGVLEGIVRHVHVVTGDEAIVDEAK